MSSKNLIIIVRVQRETTVKKYPEKSDKIRDSEKSDEIEGGGYGENIKYPFQDFSSLMPVFVV